MEKFGYESLGGVSDNGKEKGSSWVSFEVFILPRCSMVRPALAPKKRLAPGSIMG
jgi:hypothetical protein